MIDLLPIKFIAIFQKKKITFFFGGGGGGWKDGLGENNFFDNILQTNQ